MTCRILKLSLIAAIAAALLLASLGAGAEARSASKSMPAEAKSLPDASKSAPATAKPQHPAPEHPTKADEHSDLCFGRLIEMLRSRSAA